MEIIDITKNKKKYIITFDNQTIIESNEDTIIEYYLRKGLKVDDELLNKIKITSNFYNYYDQALSYLAKGVKSSYKIKQYLINKDCPNEIIDKIIVLLTERKLLDDHKYFSLLSSYYIRRNYGPYYIKNKGYEEHISDSIVEDVMSNYDIKDYMESIDILIMKYLKTSKEKDNNKLKDKLKKYLYQRGYSFELVISKVEEYYENR